MNKMQGEAPKKIELIRIMPPPMEQRARRDACFVEAGAKKGRYDLPDSLDSTSPIGFRTRVSLTEAEGEQALELLALRRPASFVPGAAVVSEVEHFEENALGVLSARQSTNYRGQRTIVLDGDGSREAAALLRQLHGLDAPVLDHATHTHVMLSRPYRTPFTTLLTFIGHKPVISLATVPWRAFQKVVRGRDDIPSVGYLQHLHVGIWADQMERAVLVASSGRRMAQVFMRPFSDSAGNQNKKIIQALEKLSGMTAAMRSEGWRIALVAQVGEISPDLAPSIEPATYRKIGANMLAFRSERIQPGVNQEPSAPAQYHARQDMNVPDDMTVMAGRAAYNAFTHWTSVSRDAAKQMLLLERIDTLAPGGKERLRDVRSHLDKVTDFVLGSIPKWIDVPARGFLSRNAERGRKAFALAGQRIYMGGLDRQAVEAAGIEWHHAIRVVGAASSRAALVAELMGVVELPEDCDLLAGICLMAGPVNQNDIGKAFFGQKDLLQAAFPNIEPTSLLFWTLKAKTVADPIGNEEQLLSTAQKGALVDLRPGPHEVVHFRTAQGLRPMRQRGSAVNNERAFADLDNFVRSVDGREVLGNRGEAWRG